MLHVNRESDLKELIKCTGLGGGFSVILFGHKMMHIDLSAWIALATIAITCIP
ncbi:MAG: hypothetical protein QXI18_01035 [Nitrososphaerota archaeon]